jgi:S1-C subfamily serine protease
MSARNERSPGTVRRRAATVAVGAVLFAGGTAAGIAFGGGGPDGPPADGTDVRATSSAPAAGSGGSAAPEAGGPDTGAPAWTRRASAAERQDAGGPPADSPRRTTIVEAAEAVTPSMVSVRVVRRQSSRGRGYFDMFFERDRLTPGLGSGFVIDREGHVLTNHHVVEGARRIQVADASGRVYDAELVGGDELTDVALLKIEPGHVPPAPLGTSDDLMVGEPALALGNPFGFHLANAEPTVTSGVISGVGREIRSPGQRGVLYADMIQTDASINPGNSGGALVNAEGDVVGVNASILSESGGSVGVGFAIPVDRALRIADELRRFGRVRQPWVGVDVASARSDTLLSRTVVRRVAPGSPAEAAGLREGDLLLAAGGTRIDGPMDWEIALLDAGVGSEVRVRFRRDEEARTTSVAVEEPPSTQAERVEVLRGLELVSVTPQIAGERDLGVERGALIVSLDREVARATRMREGDVILAVNRREVADADDAAQLFREADGRIQVWLYRDGASLITTFGVR